MDFNMTHFFGPLLVVIAFWVFGRGIVKRSRGKTFRPLPAFLLLLAALSFRFIFGEGNILDRLAMTLTDFGIGMIISSAYLAFHRERAKLFWVPGLLVLVMAGIMHLSIAVVQAIAKSICHEPTTVELLVELGPDDHIEELQPILKKYKARAEKAFENVDMEEDEDLAQFHVIYVDSAYKDPLLKELRLDTENVDDADVNHIVSLFDPIPANAPELNRYHYKANDPYLSSQWYLEKLDYNRAFDLVKNKTPKEKVIVAIVDTGVDSDHEDLKPVFKRSPGNTDKHGHGTHCAGIAGAATNNEIGIGSLNWEGKYLTILGFPALDQYGRGSDKTVSKAIIDAAEAGADVISMSLGGYSPVPPKSQKEAIEYALKLGAIVVVAAGNSNDNAKYYSPANVPGVITVSAVDENLNKAGFSNTNTSLKMPIAAPGVNIFSSIPGSKYQSFSGTSMATPLTAGLIGMMRAFKPDLTPKEAHKILKDTGKKVKDSGKVGNVVLPYAALEAVQ